MCVVLKVAAARSPGVKKFGLPSTGKLACRSGRHLEYGKAGIAGFASHNPLLCLLVILDDMNGEPPSGGSQLQWYPMKASCSFLL